MDVRISDAELGSPKVILVISGKRKSGKDFMTDLLVKRLGPEKCAVIRLSGPIKERYALEHNLDYQKLLEASEYKEIYRLEMIHWSEKIRTAQPDYFCYHAILQSRARIKNIWIVSDARRQTDIDFFHKKFPDITSFIRIHSSLEVRKSRRWNFITGIDDCESECGLDNFLKWDFQISNNNENELMQGIEDILAGIKIPEKKIQEI